MAEELEMLWQNLKVTEEEEVSVTLGDECTRAANERGKNCLVMKVLSRRSIMLEALRKNIRMLWKPNKSLQLSVISDDLFLAEFEDERDKRRVMDMRPWHYEKQLVLLKEFDGEKDPKDMTLKWSPFWVQIYNLPLKSRTRETGRAIGASLGQVLEVDVEDTGVQWGRCLRVKVEIDVTRKLIRGRKINIEKEEARWVQFKYERLPNFCYRCGLLEHDQRECSEKVGHGKGDEKEELQYGAWMRGDPVKRWGMEGVFSKKMEGARATNGERIRLDEEQNKMEKQREMVAREKQASVDNVLEENAMGLQMEKDAGGEMTTEMFHENSKVCKMGESSKETQAKKGNGKGEEESVINGLDKDLQKVIETREWVIPNFDFKPTRQNPSGDSSTDLEVEPTEEGPVAMTFEVGVGWVTDKMSPTSGHWKRRARANPGLENVKNLSPSKKKRESSSLEDIVQNPKESKRKKIEAQSEEGAGKEVFTDGGEADAARQLRRAQ